MNNSFNNDKNRTNKTNSISALLHSSAFGGMMSENKLNFVVKQSTIFSFWDSIVGSKFSKFTKPYSIKANKLYVSAKSPVVAQELSLYKTKILNKVNSYSKALGLEIKDIIFNYKNYTSTNPIKSNAVEDKPVVIEKSTLNDIELAKENKEQIQKSIDKINFLDENQKQKLADKIAENQKARIIQDNSNYTIDK